jgi:hypothetical protein
LRLEDGTDFIEERHVADAIAQLIRRQNPAI